jgi:hypothetical protein
MHSTQHLQFVWQLYQGSHSLLMFAEVFGLVWPLKRHRMLELLGWALHLLIDIPTHQGIFATIPLADSSSDSMAFAGRTACSSP